MAYGCPVCGEVHADGEHLANHLAVTASLHGDDHAGWLAEHVPDWADRSPAELGSDVIEHAPERDVESATGRDDEAAVHPGDHERSTAAPSFESALGRQSGAGRAPDRETERVLREARELTERMESEGSDTAGEDDGSDTQGDGEHSGGS